MFFPLYEFILSFYFPLFPSILLQSIWCCRVSGQNFMSPIKNLLICLKKWPARCKTTVTWLLKNTRTSWKHAHNFLLFTLTKLNEDTRLVKLVLRNILQLAKQMKTVMVTTMMAMTTKIWKKNCWSAKWSCKVACQTNICGWHEWGWHLFFACFPRIDGKPNDPAVKTMFHQILFEIIE